MVSPALTDQEEPTSLVELLQPEPLADGTRPEQRVVYCGLSWNRYLDLDKQLGHDRPGPRPSRQQARQAFRVELAKSK